MATAGGGARKTAGHEGDASRTGTPGLNGLALVLSVRPFRRLWLVLGLSSLGDWLGLLAVASFASAQMTAPAAKGAAFGSVIAVQLLPTVLLGPVAGVVADRFDRRHTMVAIDVLRFVLFASIPTVGMLVDRPVVVVAWAAGALFVAQAAAMVWTPAKDAAVPNLLPSGGLETANQLTLATTYGVAPVLAALVFAAMARLPRLDGFGPADVALYFDAVTFLASAVVVLFGIRQISGRGRAGGRAKPGVWRDLADGGRYVAATPLVRGLVVGVLGAFTGAGVVVGAAKFYAGSLGDGDATFAILFAVLFAGFGIGIVTGPQIVGGLSRRRWFGLSIVMAGAAVAALSVAPHLVGAAVAALVAGGGAGMALLSGITLLGAEVPDRIRGRVFAFMQTTVRMCLIVAISASGVLVGVGSSRHLQVGPVGVDISAVRVLLAVAGLCGIGVGLAALRQMDDRPGVPVLRDLWAALRRLPADAREGQYVVIGGFDPRAVTAQASALAIHLHEIGRPVLLAGRAADPGPLRAALTRGTVVITERILDTDTTSPMPPASTLLPEDETLTMQPVPDLVVLLDHRLSATPGHLGADIPRGRYVIVDAGRDPHVLSGEILAHIAKRL